MNRKFSLLLLLIFQIFIVSAQNDGLVEVTGLLLDKDTKDPLPGISVTVDGTQRGTVSNLNGVFSLVVNRGETITFSSVGFKADKMPVVDVNGKYKNIVRYLTIDTVFLNKVTVYNTMTPREFDFAIKYLYEPDPTLIALRNNVGATARERLLNYLSLSAAESQKMQQMQNATRYGSEYGQQYMGRLGDPRAWKQFIESWKNGKR